MIFENDLTLIMVVGVTVVGLLTAILYYFLRFFFKAGRYEDHPTSSSTESVDGSLDSQKNQTTQQSQIPFPAPVIQEEELPKDLATALAPTRANLLGRLRGLFSSHKQLSHDDREALEEILYTSDLGPKTVQHLLTAVDAKIESTDKSQLELVQQALKSEMLSILSQVRPHSTDKVADELHMSALTVSKPLIWLIVGVNGVGKTTTIGKLAYAVAQSGKKVLVAAGDTFRAAAGSQLQIWSERAQVEIFSPPGVTDPSAVAFDACQMAQSRGYDVVIIDTAGRLHTHSHLMEELKKMKRVVQKVVPEAPHETFLVLDANSGQNALMQARQFHEVLSLTGVVLTKMDGTAKGGVVIGLAHELSLPIRLIGVGEKINDLRPFQNQEFVDSIL